MTYYNSFPALKLLLVAVCLHSFDGAVCGNLPNDCQNYHIRRLYYDETDNVCYYGVDRLQLVITFNDRKQLITTIDGSTYCYPYAYRYANRIKPGYMTQYADCDQFDWTNCDNVTFLQTAHVHQVFDAIYSITQNVTVANPVTFNRKSYTCQIIGDGQIHHFGPIESHPTPRLELTCTTAQSNLIIE